MYSIQLSSKMITLIVFVQTLQKTKCKASSQYNKKNKYMNINNEKFFKLLFLENSSQIQPCSFDVIEIKISFVVN